VKYVLSGELVQWEGGGYKERTKESEYDANIIVFMYENGKMTPVETVPSMGGREIKENDGGDEFNYDTL
jgi:hypothetical protein